MTLEQGREAPSVTTLRKMLLLSEHILLCDAVQLASSYVCQSAVLDRDRNLKPQSESAAELV